MKTLQDQLETAMEIHQTGNLQEARSMYQKILEEDPSQAEASYLLGWTHRQLGDLPRACQLVAQALRLRPEHAPYHCSLGLLQSELGETDQAIASYNEAIRLNPQAYEAHFNLYRLYRKQNRINEALESCRRAIESDPQSIEAHESLSALLFDLGEIKDAITVYQKVIALNPNDPRTFFNLATFFMKLDHAEQALRCYQLALGLKPDYAEVHDAVGYALENLNRTEEAILSYQKAYESSPRDVYRIKAATALPCIYNSREEANRWRDHFRTRLEALASEPLSIENPVVALGRANFYLAYQGENDREIQQALSQLIRNLPQIKALPSLPSGGIRPNKRPTLGFISNHFNRSHTIGRLMQGIIQHINREDFNVVIFGLENPEIRKAPIDTQPGDTFLWLPAADLETACRMILETRVDILVYTDIGMDVGTYLLAHKRLAPVQCVTWGHPVTTGIDTLDYFLSTRLFEGPNPQAHYSETLWMMDSLPTCYQRPRPPETPKIREEFGFTSTDHLYICPQSLFKLHPDFDAVLAGILRQDPLGKLVLIRGNQKLLEAPLLTRWQAVMPDVTDRIVMLDTLSYEEFLSLVAFADVMLDPFPFGGGNTSLEALAFGTPIVTMPPDFMRGRVTEGFYRKMNLTETVVHSVEEYIALTVRLGTDPDFRQRLRDRILACNETLYGETAGVRELEEFFRQTLQKTGNLAQNEEKNHGEKEKSSWR